MDRFFGVASSTSLTGMTNPCSVNEQVLYLCVCVIKEKIVHRLYHVIVLTGYNKSTIHIAIVGGSGTHIV